MCYFSLSILYLKCEIMCFPILIAASALEIEVPQILSTQKGNYV